MSRKDRRLRIYEEYVSAMGLRDLLITFQMSASRLAVKLGRSAMFKGEFRSENERADLALNIAEIEILLEVLKSDSSLSKEVAYLKRSEIRKLEKFVTAIDLGK